MFRKSWGRWFGHMVHGFPRFFGPSLWEVEFYSFVYCAYFYSNDYWVGMGLFLDSFDNDGQKVFFYVDA